MTTLQQDIHTAMELPGLDSAARRRARREVNRLVRDVMIEIVNDYAQQLRGELREGGAVVTGDLVSRIGARNMQPGRRTVPHVVYPDRLHFISSGTVQERPPIEKTGSTLGPYGLREWVEMKGLTSDKYLTSRSLAWAIAKSISRKGVQAQGYREKAAGIGQGEDIYRHIQQQFQSEMKIMFGTNWREVLEHFFTLQIPWQAFGGNF